MPPINYQVPGLLRPVAQPSEVTCWAAAATIMYSWRYQASFTIPVVLERLRGPWLRYFREEQHGMDPFLLSTFADACGMDHVKYCHHTPDEWLELMEMHGPLVVMTKPWTFHARILWGMSGNLDIEGRNLTLKIVDPEGGRFRQEQFRSFGASVGRANLAEAQVWHWPTPF